MKTHPVHVTHLVFGLVFLGIAGIWALHESGAVEIDGTPWLFPLILVLAGGAGLAASVAKSLGRERREVESTDPV